MAWHGLAQVQESALQKKMQDVRIAELQARHDAALARGDRPVSAEESLEAVEEELALAMEERRSDEEARAREKKVLVAEVQRLRTLLRPPAHA